MTMNVPVIITVIDSVRHNADGTVSITLAGPHDAMTLCLSPQAAASLVQDIKLTGAVQEQRHDRER